MRRLSLCETSQPTRLLFGRSQQHPEEQLGTIQKDGILVILFDESTGSDKQHGGGHVAAVVIGPKVKRGYKSTTLYQHQNTLKNLMNALGVSSHSGASS